MFKQLLVFRLSKSILEQGQNNLQDIYQQKKYLHRHKTRQLYSSHLRILEYILRALVYLHKHIQFLSSKYCCIRRLIQSCYHHTIQKSLILHLHRLQRKLKQLWEFLLYMTIQEHPQNSRLNISR